MLVMEHGGGVQGNPRTVSEFQEGGLKARPGMELT